MKLNARQRRAWAYTIRKLKDRFPPGVPVEVRTINMRAAGDTDGVIVQGRITKVVLRISRSRTFDCKADSLVHEWAHAMEWSGHWYEYDGNPRKDHGPTWGVWYAQIYTFLYDECWAEMYDLGLLPRTAKRDD